MYITQYLCKHQLDHVVDDGMFLPVVDIDHFFCLSVTIIALTGGDVQEFHCYLTSTEGKVWLDPYGKALCAVNGKVVEGPTQLKQGNLTLSYTWLSF